MFASHPYEETAYDIYSLENYNVNYGAGALGNFEKSLSPSETLAIVSKKLNAKNMRYVHGSTNSIKKVAVCGGSGSELISEAISIGADAFITADIKYHAFHSAKDKILLIDAGHYETEIHVMDEMQKRLSKLVKEKENIKVLKFNGNTNPINIYNKIRSHIN